MDPPPCPSQGRGVVTTDLCPHQQDIILPPLVGGFGEGSVGVFYMQLAVPNVVAIAVRIVITMLRILPQMELLLNVPIV